MKKLFSNDNSIKYIKIKRNIVTSYFKLIKVKNNTETI